eukprot:TRINITY_DN18259_c0_g1_i1.p1 TRINITY_DN18259_c0_g1~~TRINITY_DN18259_c0_g1_i1.p1  ORF type:complete len:194 (+),score=33.49 TRINITY_DN18259_c0_g1_i1:73-654(+)
MSKRTQSTKRKKNPKKKTQKPNGTIRREDEETTLLNEGHQKELEKEAEKEADGNSTLPEGCSMTLVCGRKTYTADNVEALRRLIDHFKDNEDPFVCFETAPQLYPGGSIQTRQNRMIECINAFHRSRLSPIAQSPNYTATSKDLRLGVHFAAIDTVFNFLYHLTTKEWADAGHRIGTISWATSTGDFFYHVRL